MVLKSTQSPPNPNFNIGKNIKKHWRKIVLNFRQAERQMLQQPLFDSAPSTVTLGALPWSVCNKPDICLQMTEDGPFPTHIQPSNYSSSSCHPKQVRSKKLITITMCLVALKPGDQLAATNHNPGFFTFLPPSFLLHLHPEVPRHLEWGGKKTKQKKPQTKQTKTINNKQSKPKNPITALCQCLRPPWPLQAISVSAQ